ncbi:serine threonine protein kinase [Stemphylium lycopersici]|uniref:Serine threonine protein kinase n=1 Tax=Stemphylium lycopersici TaxID=183478 RepID=A0A364MVU2_STELY|nr:serine threonine protein kinase [Stemphylium lycopersici]RAR04325.1 serine threonine protein kinase [Stemphylium lycopersici]
MNDYQPADIDLSRERQRIKEMMAAEEQPGSKLAMAIHQRMVWSAFSQKLFLPQDALEQILTVDTVHDELREATGKCPDKKLVKYIFDHARRTFAILAYRGTVAKAVRLQLFRFDDTSLPVSRRQDKLHSLNGPPQDDPAWDFFYRWSWGDITNFCTDQMPFLPKTFHKDSDMEELSQGQPLPFLTFRTLGDGGSFSILHKGTMHHAHHPVPGGNLGIAIKELHDKTDGAYDQELQALREAREMNHPNIVKFIGGFRQDSKSYLIFEWADGRNLREYWNDDTNWRRDEKLIGWTLQQICGLASALDKWHNFASGSAMNGRHGDLKPENILRSTRSGGDIFQIADLGLAKVHSQPTHIRKNPSTTARGTLRYLSPEVHSSTPQKISRSYDMWSMGCTILEWIIWLVYGPKEFLVFQNQCFPTELEQFFVFENGKPVVRSVIRSWIERMEDNNLRSDEQCYSGALRDLLLFVRERLLVPASRDDVTGSSDLPTGSSASGVEVKLTAAAESPSAGIGRAKSGALCEKLGELVETAKRRHNYMFNPQVIINASNHAGHLQRPENSLLKPDHRVKARAEVNGPAGDQRKIF